MFNPSDDIDIADDADVPSLKVKARGPRRGETLSAAAKLHLDREMTVAWLYEAEDGGPVRNIITGRHVKPTGKLYLIKAGHRSMAWESMRGEEPLMRLAEVATPVHRILAQPHRLEMNVLGSTKLWEFTPDLRIEVDAAFADLLGSGIAFAHAVDLWRPSMATGNLRTVIIEMKDDDDPRLHDEIYQVKLTLASQVYSGLGWSFVQLVRSRDLERPQIAYAVREIFLDHDTVLTATDIRIAQELARGDGCALGRLAGALGGTPFGLAKAAALHVRRVISIQLDVSLDPSSPVRLVPGTADVAEFVRS